MKTKGFRKTSKEAFRWLMGLNRSHFNKKIYLVTGQSTSKLCFRIYSVEGFWLQHPYLEE
jgi:hypothetical protein